MAANSPMSGLGPSPALVTVYLTPLSMVVTVADDDAVLSMSLLSSSSAQAGKVLVDATMAAAVVPVIIEVKKS